MTTTEILKQEINNDLSMYKMWCEKFLSAETKEDIEYYRGCMLRSRYKAEAKEDLMAALGYTVLYNDERDEVISVYSMKLYD